MDGRRGRSLHAQGRDAAYRPCFARRRPGQADGDGGRRTAFRGRLCLRLRAVAAQGVSPFARRSEEHTSELQSLMRISYAVVCLKKKTSIYRASFVYHTILYTTTPFRL